MSLRNKWRLVYFYIKIQGLDNRFLFISLPLSDMRYLILLLNPLTLLFAFIVTGGVTVVARLVRTESVPCDINNPLRYTDLHISQTLPKTNKINKVSVKDSISKFKWQTSVWFIFWEDSVWVVLVKTPSTCLSEPEYFAVDLRVGAVNDSQWSLLMLLPDAFRKQNGRT